MNVSLQDVREALGELGKFRFGEMRVEDALHEIVHTTHAMFGVDGAGTFRSALTRRFACALSSRILESAVETPPRLQRSSVKADFRPRVSLRFRREDAPWQQSAEIAQSCQR